MITMKRDTLLLVLFLAVYLDIRKDNQKGQSPKKMGGGGTGLGAGRKTW